MGQFGTGKKIERHADQYHDAKSTEIGLQSQKQANKTENEKKRHECHDLMGMLMTPSEPRGQIDNESKFEKFRRLYRHNSQIQPPRSALDAQTNARHHHQHHKTDGNDKNWQGKCPPARNWHF